ncbi:MAG: ATP-binding cassette domain-containing protein [Gammaproteobacteria bacterium]
MNAPVAHSAGILPLELENVAFAAGGHTLLGPLSLNLTGHDRTIVLGPNGAGKSLLMRLCHGLLLPTAGNIRWRNGVDKPNRRQAMVFQKPVLLRRSALANLTHALYLRGVPFRQRRTRASQALARFGLSVQTARSARVLSGGEQQRLALARAWLLEPEVLFLDEPTASLDPAAALLVEEAIHDFHRAGAKIVMATHDLGQARRLAEEVVFLHRGRLLERTPAKTFFDAPVSTEARAFIKGELVN